jgi:hypothetical protein
VIPSFLFQLAAPSEPAANAPLTDEPAQRVKLLHQMLLLILTLVQLYVKESSATVTVQDPL